MNKIMISQLRQSFDQLVNHVGNTAIEFWYGRELMVELGYDRWENFVKVIGKAGIACKNAGFDSDDHFREVTKMVRIGSGADRKIADVMLTRYACYLIAQNGDPRKETIAFAQTYFALQTRKQEILEERLELQDRLDARQKLKESETELSKNIYERDVDERGFGRIRSKGDAALFGGHSTSVMKQKLGMPERRPLADFLPTVTIAAKNLATEITNHNVTSHDLHGEHPITSEHIQNNHSVRSMLQERGITPENLPPEVDINKLQRKVEKNEQKMIGESRLPKDHLATDKKS